MASKYHQVEAEIDEAISFQRDQTEPLKITHLASLFNVPYDRLRRRLQGNDSRTTRAPTNSCSRCTRSNAERRQHICYVGSVSKGWRREKDRRCIWVDSKAALFIS